MLEKIIHFSIGNKFIIGLFTLVLVALGSYSLYTLPIDALPDITNNQVQIITTSPKLATQEVEQFITYPIEQSVKSIPGVIELRSISRFGLSVVTVVFEESTDIYWARAQIGESIKEAEESIPANAGRPELAPVSTGLGEIYQYVVFPKKGFESQFNATDLRTIQDWIIKPQLMGTKGVAEVNTLGGYLKQYEIAVQPDKLKSMNTTITEIFDALENNNENTGGAYIDKKPYAYFIRGIGMVNGIDDIKKIVVKNQNGIPILIRDVADVRIGSSIRYGAVTKDGKGEEVTGMVMMLKGQNSGEVVALVKKKMEQIKKSLPNGVSIEPFMDRTKLVDRAISTVERNLIEGALIVIFVLVLLLGNWRAGLVVASVIPLALLFAISMMKLFGVSGNLMSLGAIDFGLIVDGAVIIVEATLFGLEHIASKKRLTQTEMDEEVAKSTGKMMKSAAFGQIIILIVYLPILSLTGIEGKMFGPMAQTVSFAIIGAFLLSLTYVPMVSSLVLDKQTGHKHNISDKIINTLYKWYAPILNKALKMKNAVIAIAVVLFALALIVFNNLGGEFIPTLDEGDIATHLIIASGSSLSQEIEATTKAEKILKAKFPEIKMIVTKIGSAEIPTDPMPVEAGDMIILLKDRSEWTSAETKEELMEKMEAALADIPGASTEFSQPIQMRFNELMTGVRSDVAVKIFGDDIDLLVSKGDEALKIINGVEGVSDAKAERVAGLPQITIRYNKDKLALYGLKIGDLNKVISMGFAGEVAGVVYEGEKRFDLVVRLDESSRGDISNIKSLFVTLPSGNQIPLEQIADVAYEDGPMQISREDGKRRIVVGFNVRGRDISSVVAEIGKLLDARLKMPEGYYITYGGQFENLVDANKRLAIALPVALGLILVLLYFTFRSLKQSLLIFTAIPLSAIGGVFALWLRDMPFSISAGVGFIALFGVAVLNGIVLIGYFNQLKSEGMENLEQRIKEGTKVRLRPVMMTAAVASLGFLPMAISTSAGAEVQKPLATVVIGGLITATLLTLIVLPVLYYFFEKGFKAQANVTAIGLIFIGCFICENASAQQTPMTLEQAESIGIKNNRSIHVSELDLKMNTQLIRTAFDIPKTELTGTFGQISSNAQDKNIGISQSINPFKIGATRKLLQENSNASALQLEATKQEILFEIRNAWNNILFYQHQILTLGEHGKVMDKFVKSAELKFRVGETNSLEKNIAGAKQQEFRQRVKQNEALLRIEKSKLKMLLNATQDFILLDSEFVPLVFNLKGDSTLIGQSTAAKLAEKQIQIAEANTKAERANLYPDISAGYFIQSIAGSQEVNGTPVNYDNALRFQGFTVGLSLPVFSGSISAKAKAAKIGIEREKENTAYVKAQLGIRLSEEMEQFQTAQSEIEYFKTSGAPNAEKILGNATKSYQNGDISYVEYTQNIETATAILLRYSEAIYKYNQTVINIRYLINQ
ncbi:acriflavine resistance protein B [Flavobacterium noncentrifugens]|uniref:Cobalt-zinc-cadmium resistance protein CzcA n=1 Tax=Flavobacterium noncentrifugens TaxID=1128970 RepID=A0A1G8ZPQ1_9FLAO|nr:CusA/CzcA family heavy metal efflux RND transporter [Flavobacterium noncentrifugens]GEP51879.1 acriflavine resistance protein B [Flavobacterium noncentrifugens]SDK17092.1 cobalt-zinc-cadmium resistance protein CzcA [Flavobacterium noncentrifugens]